MSVAIAVAPAPAALPPHAWYFFAIFSGVIAGLMLEPLPGPAVCLLGVTIATVLAPWVLYSATELAAPGFDATTAALTWALSGFANSTVWLIFGAYTFALGYEKTGLGRRVALLLIRSMGQTTLALGYAIVAADVLLAPFTPSSTGRSAGTLYPVIRNMPPLYGSLPNDPSRRLIGSYLMWVALAAGTITSSMFLTGMAPNLFAVELVKKTVGLEISWIDWFLWFAPVGIVLVLALPYLTYLLYPPAITRSPEVTVWAADQLALMGPPTRREVTLGCLVALALALWIFGTNLVNPTTTALLVVGLMLLARVVTWDDIVANKQAWATLVWFATLIVLADGLNRTGFIAWFARSIAGHVAPLSTTTATIVLVSAYFAAHYMFASVTAHTTAMLPVLLGVGIAVPGMPVTRLALLLLFSGGIMSVLTPYGAGPNPVYYGSGYLPARDFWRLGAIFGFIFFAAWLVFGVWSLPVS